MINENEVMEALAQVNDPELHRSLTELKMVRKVSVHGGKVDVIIALTVPNCPMKGKIETDVRQAIAALPGVEEVTVELTSMTDEERKAVFGEPKGGSATPYNRIQRVIAVMSGKGGVGKSLVTGLLAAALRRNCYQVGILDADITGPSIPMLFGLHGPVEVGPVGIRPLESEEGIKIMSMNFLLDSEDRPVIWRGPLISKTITQLWGDVMWGELDYLLVDLPPGTSDAALTTMQSLPVNGIIMVTTPQSLASMIVRKAVHMAQAVKTPIIGVVENMAYFVCPDTSKRQYIFGPSHAAEVAEAAYVPVLAQLPIDPAVARLCDAGKIEKVSLAEVPELLSAFVNIPAVQIEGLPTGHKTFSAKALELINRRENYGSLENPQAQAKVRGSCGDSIDMQLRLAEDIIQEGRFTTDGCGATIACGGMIIQLAQGNSLAEALEITPEDVIAALGGLPKDHEHCAKLAVNTLRQAIQNASVKN